MRVITFSRYFPKGHPKEGQPTYFVEKILRGIHHLSVEAKEIMDMEVWASCTPKFHTIRAGNRWKEGDVYSPRIWSGKPYNSKQVEFAPPVRIEKIWEFGIDERDYSLRDGSGIIRPLGFDLLTEIAMNDGLERDDFEHWFAGHPKRGETMFTGQILCHNPEINY